MRRVLSLAVSFVVVLTKTESFAGCPDIIDGQEVVLRDSIGGDNSSTNNNIPFANWRTSNPSPWLFIPVTITAPNNIKLKEWRAIGAQKTSQAPVFANYDYYFRVWSSQSAFNASPTTGDLVNVFFSVPSAGPSAFGTSGWIDNGFKTTWDMKFDRNSLPP